jgi:hypothetical protein
MKATVFLLGLAFSLAFELMLATSSHAIPLYRWVDADGVVHYTPSATQLPKHLRKEAEQLEVTKKEGGRELDLSTEVSRTEPLENTQEAQIAALENAIAKHQQALKELISAPREPGSATLADDPRFQAIARELPALQAKLEALQSKRNTQ